MRADRMLRLAVVTAALLALGADRPAGLTDVRDVRHWSYPDYTRVVIELEADAAPTPVSHLPADPEAGLPERLYLDVPGVWVGTRFESGIPVGDGLLQAIRLGQHTVGETRLVVDLQRYGHHRLFTLSGPPRVVLDVYGERSGAAEDAAAGAPTLAEGAAASEAPRSSASGSGGGAGEPHAPAPPLPINLRGIQKVVIDPGHGGRDPGAIGVGGVREADLTLAVALELRDRLRDRGFEVVMTRDRDVTVSLEERTALAEAAAGDVFVSIHANASGRRSAQGIETYFLDANHERHALQVAARESGVMPAQLDALQRALAPLRVSEVGSHSAALARLLQRRVVDGVRATFGPTADLGAKPGPFHVLFLSSAPSVLLEMGFVTHPGESRRLSRSLYQAVVAEQVARGLSRYRSEHATTAGRDASGDESAG